MKHREIRKKRSDSKPGKDANCVYLLAVALCICLAACSSGLGRVDGRIVDESAHDAPLANAIVVIVRGRGVFALADSGWACEDLELTYSDEQGRFHFDRWSPLHRPVWKLIFPDRYLITLTVYKRGFASLRKGPSTEIDDTFDGLVKVSPYNDSFEREAQYMHNVVAGVECNDSVYYLAVRPLLHEIEVDARALAITPEQQQFVEREFGLRGRDKWGNSFKNPRSQSPHEPPRVPAAHDPGPKPVPAEAASH
jgi:hypothetical protein